MTVTRRVRAVVRGRVQGVGFRYSTADAARRLGVAGHVRNLPDGSVEAVLEGADDDVAAVLTFLRAGPPAARVTAVTVTDVVPRGETHFRIEA